ncbi:MAG TPA: hypothetical protein VNR62_12315, partial [Cellulomonas sp.]|nr:hypothetical protein [Cellulomonas sp.]
MLAQSASAAQGDRAAAHSSTSPQVAPSPSQPALQTHAPDVQLAWGSHEPQSAVDPPGSSVEQDANTRNEATASQDRVFIAVSPWIRM